MNSNKDDITGQLTVKAAGAKGGFSTLLRYGKQHFREIGKKGQTSLATKINSEQRRSWGALGGRPRRRHYSDKGEKR